MNALSTRKPVWTAMSAHCRTCRAEMHAILRMAGMEGVQDLLGRGLGGGRRPDNLSPSTWRACQAGLCSLTLTTDERRLLMKQVVNSMLKTTRGRTVRNGQSSLGEGSTVLSCESAEIESTGSGLGNGSTHLDVACMPASIRSRSDARCRRPSYRSATQSAGGKCPGCQQRHFGPRQTSTKTGIHEFEVMNAEKALLRRINQSSR